MFGARKERNSSMLFRYPGYKKVKLPALPTLPYSGIIYVQLQLAVLKIMLDSALQYLYLLKEMTWIR
jgi:hypothetical protein